MHLSLVSLSLLTWSSLVLGRNVPRLNVNRSPVGLPGWSLQAATCPVGSATCGVGLGACCPESMHCATPANSEVAACCLTTGECRGDIELAPKCADNSWSLWAGLDGNDFCCEVGMVGAYDHISHRAGTCVASVVAPTTAAVLRSTGTGSVTTSVPTATTSPTSIVVTSAAISTSSSIIVSAPKSSSSSVVVSKPSSSSAVASNPASTTISDSAAKAATSGATTGKPVFFHYMVGGIEDPHCEQDIKDAIALGVDAFALNVQNVTASWATDTITSLFKYANTYGFKLFFSFDMTAFTEPSQFIPILESYVTNAAHYTYNGLPFVSTFNGGASTYTFGQSTVNEGWKVAFQDVMSSAGHPIYFVPSFQDVAASPTFFSSEFPTVDGAFNWNSWPFVGAGDIPVPTTDDVTYQTGAKASSKTFMMGISPLQFKHIDNTQNWYRRGEENLEVRFGQVLNLQPDFLEFQTWNDAGESHYMGNSWPEALVTNTSAEAVISLQYDHTGYWQILGSFIKLYKSGATSTDAMYPINGASVQGTFWHHTLLRDGTCTSGTAALDSEGLPKPDGWQDAEDKVTAVVLVAEGETGLNASISVGGKVVGTKGLEVGFNTMVVSNITTGVVSMSVVDGATGATIVSGTGPLSVVDSAELCNYNFQVVGLA